MDFFEKNMRETLEAINNSVVNNFYLVNTKRIRKFHNIKPSNRSKINFIWRSLKILEEKEILVSNGRTNPKSYKIKIREPINIEQFIKKLP